MDSQLGRTKDAVPTGNAANPSQQEVHAAENQDTCPVAGESGECQCGYNSDNESEWSTDSELSYSDCVYHPNELEEMQREESLDGEVDSESDEIEDVSTCSLPIPRIYYGPYRIFFDMEVDSCFIGRVIIKLGKEFPTCRDHIDDLCTGNMSPRGNLTMHYTSTKIHRAVDRQYIEGGILRPLVPEMFDTMYTPNDNVRNPQFYDSYMLVAKKDINDVCGGARFFITTSTRVMHCDPALVPIGCVVYGMDVIDHIAALPKNEEGIFTNSITIGHCGSINMDDDYRSVKRRLEKKDGQLSTFLKKLRSRKHGHKKRIRTSSYQTKVQVDDSREPEDNIDDGKCCSENCSSRNLDN